MEAPFDIVVYDKDMNFMGFVTDPIYCNFVPSWHNQGYGSFMVDSDNPHSAALQAKGARVGIDYRGEHLMSGPIRSYQGDLLKNTAVTYQFLADIRMLQNTLLFVNPANPLEADSLSALAQAWRPEGGSSPVGTVTGQHPYFLWPNGSPATGGLTVDTTEAAIKWAIQTNLVDRLDRQITIAPDLGRGGDPTDILPGLRFVPLDEVMTPLLKFSKLGITFKQHRMSNTITVDVVEPGVWATKLTPESGIVKSGTYSVGTPDITRPILGGPGETSSRVFSGIEGPGNLTDREVDYNDVIEVFRDATGATLNWPASLTDEYRVAKYYGQRAEPEDVQKLADYFAAEQARGLAAGPPTSGLLLKLAETATFHFGGPDGVQLGDYITVRANGQDFPEQVTGAQIVFTRDNGLEVTPLTGERKDDPEEQFAAAIANLARALRNISTSK